ncbi:MAG TPA: BlaI/MecI/CopY family transcriptional regulator [Bryobacteraceae bacterium]|nr:BlaI/MecI/CopY family transcriptional regulator [Bryobacteraceae bacterium]
MRKAGPPRDIPPPLELLCLKALWSLQEANVRDVQHTLAESRDLAYTTVMTLLERLVRKGAVARRKAGRAFLYVPQVTREAIRQRALKEFLDTYFDGREDDLLSFLGEHQSAATAVASAGAVPSPVEPGQEAGGDAPADVRLDAVLL